MNSPAAVHIILPVYSVLLAYFFGAGVAHMVSIGRQGAGYLPCRITSVLAMAMYYFPFRVFFTLGNKKFHMVGDISSRHGLRLPGDLAAFRAVML